MFVNVLLVPVFHLRVPASVLHGGHLCFNSAVQFSQLLHTLSC